MGRFKMGKRIACIVGIFIAVTGCGREPSGSVTVEAASEETPRYSAESFFDTVSYRLADSNGHAFSADGSRLLVSSDESGVFNAYSISVTDGSREPLSSSRDNAIFAVSWFPEDGRALLTGDAGGNEQNSVFVREEDGRVIDLTPAGEYDIAGAESGLRFLSWRDDGEAFFLTSTERDPEVADLYRYDASTYERDMLFENSGPPFPTRGFRISADGRWLALDFHHTRYDFDIYLVDLESEQRQAEQILTSADVEIVHTAIGFSPDSRYLVYGTDEYGEFLQAWTYDTQSGSRAPLVQADWDVNDVGWSPDGRYRVVETNADSRTELTVTDTGTDQKETFSGLSDGQMDEIRFDAAAETAAVLMESDTSPADVYLIDLPDGEARRLTQALNPAIDEDHLVASEVVWFESHDGLDVPGLMYRPREASAGNPVPAMVWIHGGPGAQSRQGFRPVIQHLVNNGYAVYAINNRGSDGYGKTFRSLDRRRHGEADLADVVASRKFLAFQDWIDAERIGVMGGSYGGFLTAAALTFTPEVFDVGINIFGVTNWIHMLGEPNWRLPRQAAAFDEIGHPDEDAERLRRISPYFHVGNIKRPMLVVQGVNDARVPKVQTDEFVAAAKAQGVQVEYIVFAGEGHGFRKRENRVTASEAYLGFLERYLRR
ncbi:MAG: S9 family peptidase [Woeseia sp.]